MRALHIKQEQEGHVDVGYQDGQYYTELYQSYRNMTMNFCCAFLVFSLYITSYHYEAYKPLKAKANELTEKLGKKEAAD